MHGRGCEETHHWMVGVGGGGVRWGITRIEAEVLWAGIRRTANVHFTIKPGWSVCGQ